MKKNITNDSLAEQLSNISKGVELLDHGSSLGRRRLVITPDGVYAYKWDIEPDIAEVVGSIINSQKYRDYIAENHARKLVDRAVLKTVKLRNAKKAAGELIASLSDNNKKKSEIVIPLEGLIFKQGRSIKFGKVTIERFNASRAKRHTDKVLGTIVMEGQKPLGIPSVEWGRTNAVVTLLAFEGSAWDIARRLVQEALDILRVFIHYIIYSPDSSYFGIRGSRAAYAQTLTGYCHTTRKAGVSSSVVGPVRGIEVDVARRRWFRRDRYFNALSKILEKDRSKLTVFENRLITAAQWLGRSYTESDVKIRFLYAAISAECLLSLDRRQLTEHLAICISRICGKEAATRKQLYRKVKRLYSKRSRLVHEGGDELDLKDVRVMRELARLVLVYSLNNWPKVTSDNQWVDTLIGLKTN